MLNPLVLLVGSVIFLIYGGINYYIVLRGWQALFSYVPFLSSKVYWPIFVLLSFSYLFSRLSEKFLPTALYEWLTLIGAYWLAFMSYFLIVITAIDILRLFDRWLRFVPVEIKQNLNPTLGVIIFI